MSSFLPSSPPRSRSPLSSGSQGHLPPPAQARYRVQGEVHRGRWTLSPTRDTAKDGVHGAELVTVCISHWRTREAVMGSG